MITINIGLQQGLPASPISYCTALSSLASHGFQVFAHRVAQSTTEPTLVALAVEPSGGAPWGDALYLVAVELGQTAIAWSGDGGVSGGLIGPGARSWGGGVFDSAFFIPICP